jgi:hypothetical protein
MNILLFIVVHTANILGIFTDPFEFEGDYGPEVNPIRKKVFEQVVSPEALARNLSDAEVAGLMGNERASEGEMREYREELIAQAAKREREYGPTLSQLITPELIEEIKKKQKTLEKAGFTAAQLDHILSFIERYKDQKVFHFLRNNPPELLGFDKVLRDRAAREGKPFDLPILGSIQPLAGKNSLELKQELLEALFTPEKLSLAKSQTSIEKALAKLDPGYLKEFFGEEAHTEELMAFSTPGGQLFFYWMYQALNLHLISTEPKAVEQVNKVKEIFAHTLGNSAARAETLKERLLASQSGLLFTQESDALVPRLLSGEGLFHPVDRQNGQDGTLVLLRSDLWEADYRVISMDDYEGFQSGKLNVILAKQKGTGKEFLLASCHGHSTHAEDGRLQITLIKKKFDELSDGHLQLIIGIDANTKSEEDVKLFHQHLDSLGLVATQVGPTTVKKRMVTAQHAKAGRFAIDEEDYIIVLKSEKGGQFTLSHLTVGFKEGERDPQQSLPNLDNPSDHYAVGATLVELP